MFKNQEIYRVLIKISVQSSIHDFNAKVLNKFTSVTEWPREWQTENASKVNIFNIKIHFL